MLLEVVGATSNAGFFSLACRKARNTSSVEAFDDDARVSRF